MAKHEVDEEAEAFLGDGGQHVKEEMGSADEKRRSGWRKWVNLRLGFEGILVLVVFWLLFSRAKPSCRLRSSPVPEFPRKIYTFFNDPRFTREDMFTSEELTLQTLHNWIPLSSLSRGYIRSPPPGPYSLSTPYEIAYDRHNDGPGYMVSVFHQLHCLSYLAERYQQGYGGANLTTEVAHHSAHCFNYIRQALMCNADLTLEGKTEAGPGEGHEHECVDYDAVLAWANEEGRVGYKWRNGLLPEDSIL